eukprot:3940938-Rhodomonas_salina.2
MSSADIAFTATRVSSTSRRCRLRSEAIFRTRSTLSPVPAARLGRKRYVRAREWYDSGGVSGCAERRVSRHDQIPRMCDSGCSGWLPVQSFRGAGVSESLARRSDHDHDSDHDFTTIMTRIMMVVKS